MELSLKRISPRLTDLLPSLLFDGKVCGSLRPLHVCLNILTLSVLLAKPLSQFVETYGTEKEGMITQAIMGIHKLEFDCRPGALAQDLQFQEPKYNNMAAYCHFGCDFVVQDLQSQQKHGIDLDYRYSQFPPVKNAAKRLQEWWNKEMR